MTRSIIIALCFVVAGCTSSRQDLPLTTPETFDRGLHILDSMVNQGKVAEARDYADRHKTIEPVIYWAFQIQINDRIYDHNPRRTDTMHSYEEFFKAYQKEYLNNDKGVQLGVGGEASKPAPPQH